MKISYLYVAFFTLITFFNCDRVTDPDDIPGDINVAWVCVSDLNNTRGVLLYWDGNSVEQIGDTIISSLTAGPNLDISGNNIVWTSHDGNDHEIFFWDGSTITQITDNNYSDIDPKISGNNVVWNGGVDPNSFDIFFWDGSTVTQITDNDYNEREPRISGNNVVWHRILDLISVYIFFWDGNTVTQITDTVINYYYPQISGNNVVWAGYDGNDSEVFLWNGSTVTQITDDAYYHINPQISGNNVVCVLLPRQLNTTHIVWHKVFFLYGKNRLQKTYARSTI